MEMPTRNIKIGDTETIEIVVESIDGRRFEARAKLGRTNSEAELEISGAWQGNKIQF